jgi:hypothetical protein
MHAVLPRRHSAARSTRLRVSLDHARLEIPPARAMQRHEGAEPDAILATLTRYAENGASSALPAAGFSPNFLRENVCIAARRTLDARSYKA